MTGDEIAALYGERYFNGEEYSNYLDEEESLRLNFKKRNRLISRYLDASSCSMLEVGCAYGFYVEEASQHFKTCMGIDVAKNAVEYGKKYRKLELVNGNFLEHDFGENRFDLICMWDTIEHLENPKAFTLRANKLLKKNGLFAFTTGDISALVPRFRGSKWRMIHPPTHLQYFSKKSVSKLMESNGFEIVVIKHEGLHRTIGNISYNLFVLRNSLPWVHKLLTKCHLTELPLYLNTFDVMTVICRKH